MSQHSLEEVIELAGSMASSAARDGQEAEDRGDHLEAAFWEGWEGGLETLLTHIRTGVKLSCFPVGSCSCHPFVIARKADSISLWQRIRTRRSGASR